MNGDVVVKRDRSKSPCCMLLIGIAMLAERGVQARTFNVDSTVDAVDATIGDGLCAAADGSCTLRAAVNEANDDPSRDTIIVPAGTYTLTIPPDFVGTSLFGDLDIWADVTIRGAGANQTIIDANHLDRSFHVLTRVRTIRLRLRGVSIVNGAPPENHGGAISAFDADIRLVDSIVARNQASIGAGVEILGGRLKLIDSQVSDNVGNGGTGIRAMIDARVVLKRATVSDNRTTPGSYPGAGIFCFPGTELVVKDSVVSRNRSSGAGGGIMFGGARGRIVRSTIQENEAGGGAGVSLYRDPDPAAAPPGTLTIDRSQIVNNVATTNGGIGGGIWSAPPTFASDSPPVLRNTTITGNVGGAETPDCSGSFIDRGGVVIGDPTGCVLLSR